MPELELLSLQGELESAGKPYVLATVVRVRGSASAKPGAKMVVSAAGENLLGWVGGGCAESFTREQALEALSEGRPRTIEVNLDDELFGLGMPCGGAMEIFLEPRLAAETLRLPPSPAVRRLAEHFGFRTSPALDHAELGPAARADATHNNPASALYSLATAIAEARGLLPLRRLCEGALPVSFAAHAPSELLILGHSRITEELARLAAPLGWPTRVYGLGLDERPYPASVRASAAAPDYAGLEIREGSAVVVASHHKGDHHYLAEALRADAAYVGLVASRRRCGLVFEHLRSTGTSSGDLARVSAPAGLRLHCQTPREIALSILAELVSPLTI